LISLTHRGQGSMHKSQWRPNQDIEKIILALALTHSETLVQSKTGIIYQDINRTTFILNPKLYRLDSLISSKVGANDLYLNAELVSPSFRPFI
jgi:hypothetical protein